MTSNCNRFLSFFWLSKVHFLIQYECMMSCNISDLYIPHQKKISPNIDGVHIVGGKDVLIPVVNSSGMTYANVISVPAKEYNRYMIYITTYLLSDAHTFNATWIVLHTL
jgi:hypothetical protein